MIMRSFPSLTFKEAIIMSFEKFFKISGRSRRSEFWNFFLLFCIESMFSVPMIMLFENKKKNMIMNIIFPIYSFLIDVSFIGLIIISIRRLHDIGKSGGLLILNIIPLFGNLLFLKYLMQDSDKRGNKYGPSPKYYEENDNFFIGQENMLQQIELQENPNQNNYNQLNAPQIRQMPQEMSLDLYNNSNNPPLVKNQYNEPAIYQGDA